MEKSVCKGKQSGMAWKLPQHLNTIFRWWRRPQENIIQGLWSQLVYSSHLTTSQFHLKWLDVSRSVQHSCFENCFYLVSFYSPLQIDGGVLTVIN